MDRRSFIRQSGVLALLGAGAAFWPASARAELTRAQAWAPTAQPTVGAEWRYLAGRITTPQDDYGFIVSIGMTRSTSNPSVRTYQLLVERIDFAGDGGYIHAIYPGQQSFANETYTFTSSTANATWSWDEAAQLYRLTVATPELSFENLVLRPAGVLIPEGGSGTIDVGETRGFVVKSDYYAHWVGVEAGGAAVGVARLDMQCLYLTLESAPDTSDYDHHWFAIAGELDGAPVYLSAWRIESARGPFWDVTIARGNGATWTVESLTQKNAVAQPLYVVPLAYQPIPGPTPPAVGFPNQTGSAWRISAGKTTAADLIELDISVPPGQFIETGRLGTSSQNKLLESIGTKASGTILGKPLTNVRLVVAESTAEFAPHFQHIPLASS